jgi:hypothetical protein
MDSTSQLDAKPMAVRGWFLWSSLRVWDFFECVLVEAGSILTAFDPFDVAADKIIRSVSRSADETRKRSAQG